MELKMSSIYPSIFKNSDMRPNLLMLIIVPVFASCQSPVKKDEKNLPVVSNGANDHAVRVARKVSDIALPGGYKRIARAQNSFASWLQQLPLKLDSRVFLYNGDLKANQSAQFAVLDIPVGKKDLQQCADAVMRLRAQYLFDQERFAEISFMDNNGKQYAYSSPGKEPFDRYLERVFSYCGTLSLERQLRKISIMDMKPGDVFIKGGSPGHAVIVLDVAENNSGERIFMLAQSYMPAQDIHVLRNPASEVPGPWFKLSRNSLINTPEWTFEPSQLRTW